MTIGINASAMIKQPRTGVEEYAYQLIKHLTMLPEAREHRFILYVPKTTPIRGLHTDDSDKKFLPSPPLNKGGNHPSLHKEGLGENYFDFPLPENFQVQELNWSLPMWTQMRLASHLAFNKPDVLFIPVHILPITHPKNSVVTIHGLEYEYFPDYYPVLFRRYLKFSTRYAVKHAKKIIAVSENTKRDLVKLYGAKPEKISVVHHGISLCHSGESRNPDFKPGSRVKPGMTDERKPYLLYIGRIELKKNILGILEAYKILKEKYKIPHELVLVGSSGYGHEIIKLKIENLLKIENCKLKIRQLGYVSEEEKWRLLRGADAFLFPTFYEGFGLPILEAQSAGVPVVASNNSSAPEVAGDSALLVDPQSPELIADAVYKIIDDKAERDKLRQLGFENVKRFSWEKCAKDTLNIIRSV